MRDERGREVESPAHTAGVGAGRTVGGIGEVELLEQFDRAFAGHRLGQVVEPTHEREVLVTREVLVDRRVLAGEADATAHLVRVGRDVDPGDLGPAGRGLEDRGEDADGGGLAGTVRAEQTEDGAGGYLERHALQCVHVAVVLHERVGHDRRAGRASRRGGWEDMCFTLEDC